jgi:site-specific recombinase XerD
MLNENRLFNKAASQMDVVTSAHLPALLDSWLLAGDINRHSARTIETRRERVGRLVWFLNHKELPCCGLAELRAFFVYLNHGHKEPRGRWGNPKMVRPLTSGRVKSYHSTLRTFFAWLVMEGEIDASPMVRIPVPVDRPDQIRPFTDHDLKALLAAAKRTKANPKRDHAILLLLLDTGVRASELCALDVRDVDWQAGQLLVREGKGGKSRTIPFSPTTKRALYQYLTTRLLTEEEDEPLFLSEHGQTAGDRLKVRGVQMLMIRMGNATGIDGVHCHRFRHTYAISFLRSGGNQFSLMMMLGHTSVTVTARYVALAQADVQAQRRFSPVEALKRRKI